MKKLLISSIVASALLTASISAKENNNTIAPITAKVQSVQEVNDGAVNSAKNNAEDHQVKLVKEAISSLNYASNALFLMDKNATQAQDLLEKSLGKLELILANENAPKFLPIKNTFAINEFKGTSKDVEIILEKVATLLDKNRVQEARILMIPLQSEIDITTISLPLVSYPDALKLAGKYLHSNEVKKAQEVLRLALSTFQEATTVLPIPLIQTSDLILEASKLAKTDKKKATEYLNAANESLNLAEKLGYISKSITTYQVLHDKIETIKKEIQGKNSVEKLFDKLKDTFKEFKAKVESSEQK